MSYFTADGNYFSHNQIHEGFASVRPVTTNSVTKLSPLAESEQQLVSLQKQLIAAQSAYTKDEVSNRKLISSAQMKHDKSLNIANTDINAYNIANNAVSEANTFFINQENNNNRAKNTVSEATQYASNAQETLKVAEAALAKAKKAASDAQSDFTTAQKTQDSTSTQEKNG